MARDTILIVDNDLANVEQLRLSFQDKYKVISCKNGKEALEFLTANHKSIAIIMLELVLPVVDGLVLLRVLNSKGITKLIPVVAMTSEATVDKIKLCFDNGAIDFVSKPVDSIIVGGRIKNLIELCRSRVNLEAVILEQTSKIKKQNNQLQGYNDRIIEIMSTIIEFRNLESGNHIKRIKEMTKVIAEMLKRMYPEEYSYSVEDIDIMESASALHDIGKIAISDTILLKPGRLSADEFEVIKSHTTLGCEILTQIQELQDKHYMEISYNICRHHHERYDGKGYPDRLSGENIPIEAQIVSIVDAYEALVGERVYRDAFEKEKAFNMIIHGECGEFSEKLINAFTKSRGILEKIVDKYSEE